MKRWPGTTMGLLVVALTVFGCATQPSGDGWITLVDGSSASLNN